MTWYNRGLHIIMDRTAAGVGEPPLDLQLDRVIACLMKTSYVPNIDTDDQFDTIAASEIAPTNYTARGNGQQLASKTVTIDLVNDHVEFDAADLVFSSIGGATNETFNKVVIAREQDAGASDANTELLGYADVNSTTTTGGDVTLTWNVEGILNIAI